MYGVPFERFLFMLATMFLDAIIMPSGPAIAHHSSAMGWLESAAEFAVKLADWET